MVTIYMLIGIQGSGKSTYARVKSKELSIPIVSSDNVRDENPDSPEENTFPLVYEKCAEYIKSGTDFIYDATSITKKVRKRFFDNMALHGLTVSEYQV